MLHELYKKNKIYAAFLKSEKKEFFSCLFTIAGNTVEYFFSNSSSNHHSLIVAAINFFKKIEFLEFLSFGVVNTLDNFETLSKKKKILLYSRKGLVVKNLNIFFLRKNINYEFGM